MSSGMTISLEPPPIYSSHPEDASSSLFDRPLRLLDINPVEIYTRNDPAKSVGERLNRIFLERGDFSQLSTESIRSKAASAAADDDTLLPSVQELNAGKLTPEEMRALQTKLMERLNLARGELTTALDLLSVLAPPTNPPTIDPDSLPLASETLIMVPTCPPAQLSADPSINHLASLPVAISLSTLKSSASSFFRAFEQISSVSSPSTFDDAPQPPSSPSLRGSPTPRARSSPPDLWTTLLDLRSKSTYPLLPLGASRGATLTGKGESRIARSVGIFYGCEEAKEPFRRAAVARAIELIETIAKQQKEGKKQDDVNVGRQLMVKVKMGGDDDNDGSVQEEIAVWGDGEKELAQEDTVESLLKRRGRCAFSEELFSIISDEARSDPTLKARLTLGKRTVGDSIVMEGHGWSISFTMISNPPPETLSNRRAEVVLALVRLFLIEQYSQRRDSLTRGRMHTRSILQNISVLLVHARRLEKIELILTRIVDMVQKRGDASNTPRIGASVEYWTTRRRNGDESEMGLSALRILKEDKELGGRAVLRIGQSHVFHISYSLPLPLPSKPSPIVISTNGNHSLFLQSPHSAAIPIPSLIHLEQFLTEQVQTVVEKLSPVAS